MHIIRDMYTERISESNVIHKSRSYRRWQLERAKARERRKWSRHPYTSPDGWQPDARWIGMAARTPKRCSCWMCCNPRHALKGQNSERLTRQERIADDRMAAGLIDAQRVLACRG